jgi:M6 family metalloprotease-like protein
VRVFRKGDISIKRILRRGLAVIVAPAVLIVACAAGLSVAGERLLCTKADAPAGSNQAVLSKVFEDDLPRVTAIEKARRRGRERDGRTTVRLLAIRVQFQQDSDPRSSGNGTFDLSPWDEQTFDGPPHDRQYFELHMTALKNYYESVSYGRLTLEFDVAPEAPNEGYVLPHDMGYYHDYSEAQVWYVSQVEKFIRDAFAAADTSDTIDFSQYDGYVVFHAGADWQSDVNLDSPFDLPSAHISLGDSISVNDGAWAIWESAIMPETSNQDNISIVLNGTLAHEVGHILGLPDLYNTFNFFPAIGYWGIMDSGGRIGMNTAWGYAYGLIPGAPCAWSKEFMGWVDPVVLLDDAEGVEVKGSVLRGDGYRLFKIPMTSDEYFLIENRVDDIGKDLTVVIEQERGVVLGPADTTNCGPNDICPVNHEYDFLMPGPGLLVYHIDDTRVIPGLLPWDTVNYDRRRRGVAVEEADGIMDLGDIGSFYWAGSAYDPFFASNNASFSWDTFPSTDNNLGGKTYISLTGISEPDSVMTFDLSFDRWKDGWPIVLEEPTGALAPRVADLDGDGEAEVIVATSTGNVYAWNATGGPVIPLCGTFGHFAVVPEGISRTPAVADLDADGDMEVIVAADSGSLYVWSHEDLDLDGLADPHGSHFPVGIEGPASSPPVAADLDPRPGLEIAVASMGGYLTVVDANGEQIAASPYSFGHLVLNDVTIAAGDLDGDTSAEIVMSTTNKGWVAALNADGTSVDGWPVTVASWVYETVGVLMGDLDRSPDGFSEVVAVGSDGLVHVWDRHGRDLPGWPVSLDRTIEARAGMGDLDGDGYLELVIPADTKSVVGLRMNGTRVENWPLVADSGDSVATVRCPPVVGDLDDDGEVDVVVAGVGGNVFAWGGESGEAVPGWPLSSDASPGSPWVGDVEGDGELDLLVAGNRGRLLFYRLPYDHVPGNIVWSSEAGGPAGTGSYPDSLLPPLFEETPGLLADERTYCYPNPARGSDMTVRVYLGEAADLDVRIFDVSGQIVQSYELEGQATVNEIVWETDDVASGLYIVRVEASAPVLEAPSPFAPLGSDTRSEIKIMKAAVLR